MNGVKQVIIIPLAQSTDVVTVVSSAAFPLSSPSSSVPGGAAADTVPEDVKLLAQFCVPVTSSSSVPDLPVTSSSHVQVTSSSVAGVSRPAVFSSAANGHTPLSSVFTNHIMPTSAYQMFSASPRCFASSPAEAARNQYVAAARQFYMNSVNRTVLPTSIMPQHSPSLPQYSPSLPVISSWSPPVLPVHHYPPAQTTTPTTVPLSMATLQQRFPLPTYRNPVLRSQMEPDLNYLRQMLPHTVSQAPWTSYSPLQLRPTYARNDAAMDTAVNSGLQPGSNFTPPQPVSNLPLPNYCGADYRQFLPSLRSAVAPDLAANQPYFQLQDYLLRKRGFLPQNAVPGYQLDASNYRMPQLDPRLAGLSRNFQIPPPVTASEVRAMYTAHSVAPANPSMSHLNENSGASLAKKGGRKHRTAHISPKDNITHPLLQGNVCYESRNVHCKSFHPLDSRISHHVTSVVRAATTSCRPTASTMPPNHFQQARDNINASSCRPAAVTSTNVQVTARSSHSSSVPVTTIAVLPTMSAAGTCVTEMRQNGIGVSHCLPVAGIPTDLQVTVNQSRHVSGPVTAIATSSVAVVATYTTETTCHPAAAATKALAATTDNPTIDTLLFDIGCDLSTSCVPSSCSLTSNSSLSNLLLSTDLLPLNSVSAADAARTTVSTWDSVQPNGTGVKVGTSQVPDGLNDLESLPADVMVETAESESLLMSFCNMFEQSNIAHQHTSRPSAQVTSDAVKDSLESIGVNRESTERGLQFAKSLGKGRHFTEEVRQRRREQASRKRRRPRLTALEFADESNSSDSWHPDSQSESSENRTVSSPAPSTETSVSQSSDDFDAISRRARRRRRMLSKRNRSLRRRHVISVSQRRRDASLDRSRRAVCQKCTVSLERLELNGQHSVNVHLLDSFMCCPEGCGVKRVQRIESSDGERLPAERRTIKKLRLKILRVEDTDSG